jgi:hypothetical protein
VQVEETNVPTIRLAAPRKADTMGIQNFKSTWRRVCFLSRFALCGPLAKIAPWGGVARHDWNVSVRLANDRCHFYAEMRDVFRREGTFKSAPGLPRPRGPVA